MNTLIIYDNTGYILSVRSGEPAPREPIGVPFLWSEIPQGKVLKGVDVTGEIHQVILEDTPITDVDLLKQQVADLNIAIASIMGV